MLKKSSLLLFMMLGVLSWGHAATGDAISAQTLERLGVDAKRITVIDFFAQWCASCRKELPLISALHQRIDKSKVEFLGVDTDDSVEVANAFQKEMRDIGCLGRDAGSTHLRGQQH